MKTSHIEQLPRGSSDADRVLAYSMPEPNSGCWLWMGFISTGGYGVLNARKKLCRAHRVSYEAFKCDIPKGLDLDHLCRNRACVNPDHLEPVTRQVNCQRGETGQNTAAQKMARTHCKQGHEYTPENTWMYRGARKCIKCKYAASNRWHKRNRPRQAAYIKAWRAARRAKGGGHVVPI